MGVELLTHVDNREVTDFPFCQMDNNAHIAESIVRLLYDPLLSGNSSMNQTSPADRSMLGKIIVK